MRHLFRRIWFVGGLFIDPFVRPDNVPNEADRYTQTQVLRVRAHLEQVDTMLAKTLAAGKDEQAVERLARIFFAKVRDRVFAVMTQFENSLTPFR